MGTSKTLLNDVMIMRPVVIFLLIVTHSFTIYSGGNWPLPNGIREVGAYGEVTRVALSFMLETFVFISGYLFGMQSQGRKMAFVPFVIKKVQRLIIPSMVFGMAYMACFGDAPLFSREAFIKIANGAGHLWFLPMLFWCFIMSYCMNKLKGWGKAKLALCFVLALSSGLLPLPFRIDRACYYMLFFNLGMYIYPRRQIIISRLRGWNAALLVVLFTVLYIVFSNIENALSALEVHTFVDRSLRVAGMNLCMVIYSSAGLAMLFAIANYALRREPFHCPQWLKSLNAACFGVYIYQQFVIMFIYYSTPIPAMLGTYLLPWAGCAFATTASVLLAWLTLKTKLGRMLIG